MSGISLPNEVTHQPAYSGCSIVIPYALIHVCRTEPWIDTGAVLTNLTGDFREKEDLLPVKYRSKKLASRYLLLFDSRV